MTQAPTQRPDDDQLKKWIASSFDALPQPDSHRLMVIEQQLTEKIENNRAGKRSTTWVWLFAGALIAGSATAAWWAGEGYWFDRGEEAALKIEIPRSSEAGKRVEKARHKERDAEKAQADVVNTGEKKKKSPLIYRQGY